jgi:hypothetical protein
MQVGRTHAVSYGLSAAICIAAMITVGMLALAACSTQPKAAAETQCGTSHTAAKVPIEVAVEQGQVSCTAALAIEGDYAKAIEEGRAPGNGGGGPVTVNGWTCQGFPTPELLKTGKTSKCVKDGIEIIATLKVPG